jgi:hypothetical protein
MSLNFNVKGIADLKALLKEDGSLGPVTHVLTFATCADGKTPEQFIASIIESVFATQVVRVNQQEGEKQESGEMKKTDPSLSTAAISKDKAVNADQPMCPITNAPHHWKGAMDIRNEVYIAALNVLCEPEIGDTPLNVLATSIADDVYKSLIAAASSTQAAESGASPAIINGAVESSVPHLTESESESSSSTTVDGEEQNPDQG